MWNYQNIQKKEIRRASSASHNQLYAARSVFQLQDNRPQSFERTTIVHTFLADNRPQSFIQKKQIAEIANDQPDYTTLQKKENKTSLPDDLKSGVENLSGISMDDVNVHYHSDKPAQLNAHAYAQGTDIHIAPGQERHLPHEAWHIVQQKQGRVKPTMQLKRKVDINDDKGLENEADEMGTKATQFKESGEIPGKNLDIFSTMSFGKQVFQRVVVPGLANGTPVIIIATGRPGTIESESPRRGMYMVKTLFAGRRRGVEYSYDELDLDHLSADESSSSEMPDVEPEMEPGQAGHANAVAPPRPERWDR